MTVSLVELNDADLDAVSGGCCFAPKPIHCDPKPVCEPKPHRCDPKPVCEPKPCR